MSQIKLIVGLGNPGPVYEQHRHNVGVWFIEALARQYNAVLRPEIKLRARTAVVSIDQNEYRLLVPMTYMNESGFSVGATAQFYKIPVKSILVIHDELDLAPGTVRIKQGGGHAGHNGLRHIIQIIGDSDFFRIRIGIGHPGDRDKVSDYVLSRPNQQDLHSITSTIEETINRLSTLLAPEYRAKAIEQLHIFKAN